MDRRNNDSVSFNSIEVKSSDRDGDTSDVELNYDEDNSNSESSGEQSFNYGDDADEDDDNDDAVSADKSVSMNSMTADEIRAMEFGSVEEAYEFYCNYAKGIGFGVRKGDIRTRGPEGNKRVVMRQFVCSKNGLRADKHLSRVDRKREHRRLTRTNCGARLRVHYKGEKDRYVVTFFDEAHNHELTPARFVHLHRQYRNISEADRAQIHGLQSHGIRTCHIMGYMVAQKGGYSRVGFTKKDLYNYFDKKMRENVKDGDVAASLNYLNVKSCTDPMLYAEYAVDRISGRMKTLFWANGMSRSDYFCFGDVVAFDTTYRINKYNYPLVIFSGCNHHSQTVIFGAALVADETTETYKWVLRCFLECMEDKPPKAVITDGDGSMREAIKQVFPDAVHRLCAWHLHRNAVDNVKKAAFWEGFKKAMYSNFTTDEFEEYWSELVRANDLQNSSWVAKTYDNKLLWATAYLRETFFGRLRTTSQCEAVNAIIKNYVRKKCCIFEFMQNFDQALREYRNSEIVADFKSKFSDPVLTTALPVIESDAARIYTAEIFKEVKEQIVKAGALIVKHKKEVCDTKFYTLTKFCNDAYEKKVVYDGSSFQCSCRLFDSRGIPCSHIFYVMKEEHFSHIPSSLVLTRWTKEAKSEYLNMSSDGTTDSNMIEIARFSAYCSAFTSFCKEASKKNGVYGQIMDDIMNLKQKYCTNDDAAIGTQNPSVRDPKVVNGKGAPKRKKNQAKGVRQCTKCKETTHNARTCSGKNKASVEQNVEAEPTSVNDSVSQVVVKNNKRKTSANGERSTQKKCSGPPKYHGDNVTTTRHVDTSINRQIHPMYGVQPLMPMVHPVVHPVIQPMNPPTMYPIYGMSIGQNSNSCYDLLQQVMKSAGQD